MTKRDSIRIELTKEQQSQIKATFGHDVSAVQLNVQQLEERVAPLSLSYESIKWEYHVQNS